MAYAVVRTDLMSGTSNPEDMVSLRYQPGGDATEIQNGTIVKLTDLEEGQREVWKAEKATSTTPMRECALIVTPEVMYDERKRNLDEYVNEAGKIARGYRLRAGNMFAVTKEAFETGEGPELKATIGIHSSGKLDGAGSATTVGKCVAIETAGRYTYYVIQIGDPDSTGV